MPSMGRMSGLRIPEVLDQLGCNHTENCSWIESGPETLISVISYRYCYPAISAAGILGSLLLLVTLRDERFRAAGVFTYLRCLMLSDITALALAGATLLAETWDPLVSCDGRTITARSRCGAIWHDIDLGLVNALIGCSMGITLWMTYDRYQAVRVPHELWRRPPPESRCAGRPMRLAATLFFSLVLHIPQTLGFRAVHHCPADGEEFYELALTDFASDSWLWCGYQWSLQILLRWMPAAIMLYCNMYIIVAIKRRERRKSIADAASASRCSQVDVQEGVSERVPSSAARYSWMTSEAGSSAGSGVLGDQLKRRRRRQEAESRLELLLLAMAVSCLVTNCLQSVGTILEMVYEDNGTDFEIMRAVSNIVEVLNISMDFVYAIAFVKQIRQAFVCQLKLAWEAIRWLSLVP